MNRSHAHYWFVVTLLLCRLVLGEFVHAAAAHEQPDTQSTALAHHCEEYDAAMSTGDSPHGMHHDEHATEDSQPHSPCCKSGQCECPGMHAPALALSLAGVIPVTRSTERLLDHSIGADRPATANLFRPPIR